MVLASIPSHPSPDTTASRLPRLCPHQDSCPPLTWGDAPQTWSSVGQHWGLPSGPAEALLP